MITKLAQTPIRRLVQNSHSIRFMRTKARPTPESVSPRNAILSRLSLVTSMSDAISTRAALKPNSTAMYSRLAAPSMNAQLFAVRGRAAALLGVVLVVVIGEPQYPRCQWGEGVGQS